MNRAYTLHIEDKCHHVRSRSTSSGLAKSTAHIMTSVKKKRNRGVEFPDSWIILDSGAQGNIFRNAKLLKRLKQNSSLMMYEGLGDDTLEVTHHGIFCDSILLDWHPDTPINVLSLSLIAKHKWGVHFDENAGEFVVRTFAGQELIFWNYKDLYICDLNTQGHRNHRARVDDGVELPPYR